MFKLLSITALFAFLCAATALTVDVPGFKVSNLKIQKVEAHPQEAGDIVDLNALSRQDAVSTSSTTEDAQFSVEKYQTGFTRVVSTGIVVTKGASGILNFKIKARGVDAETISKADKSFQEVLENTSNSKLIQEYKNLKKAFKGSLNIPIYEFLGFNFLKNFNLQDAKETAESFDTTTYNALSSEALKILESFVETDVEISGTLTAYGVSFIPTVAEAFLRFSRVEFGENQSTNVFSTSTDDLLAANTRGNVIPSDNKDIVILTPTRR